MELASSNQRNGKFGLFGLLVNRLLYKASPETAHKVPDDVVTIAEKQAKEKYEAAIKKLQGVIEEYNQNFGSRAKNKKETSVYEDIELDLNNLPALKKKIRDLIAAIKEKKGEAWQASFESDPQIKTLNTLLLAIPAIEELPQRGEESVEGAHRTRLQSRHELMTESGQRRELWEKTPAYKELNTVFDSLASTPAFSGLWQNAEGLSTQKQREAKQLFFAIMAEQTHQFRDTFVLGDSFGNDPDVNIRNFPFIYNEFLKIEGVAIKADVSLDKIAEAESNVHAAERKLPLDSAGQIMSAEAIIDSNPGAGVDKTELGSTTPGMPDTNGWTERDRVLKSMVFRYEEKAKTDPKAPQNAGWEAAAQNLRLYRAHADACLSLSRLKDREKLVKSRFVLSELGKPTRRRMVMELAMRQFGRAMDMVDKGPYGNSDWQRSLHPTVRRMLIATIYESGVAAYKTDEAGKVTYEENINPENVWMMSALSLSDYFNFKEVGDNMDADHETLLKAAYLGSRISVLIEDIKPTEDVVAAWITVRHYLGDQPPTTAEQKRFVEAQMGRFPAELRARFAKHTLDQLDGPDGVLAQIQGNRKRLQKFLDRTKAAIRDPYSETSKKFIEDMKRGAYSAEMASDLNHLGSIGVIQGASLEAYIRSMYDLQINFKTAEHQESNMLMFFEGLGMHIEGIYPKYLKAIERDHSLKAEYWDSLLLGDSAAFNKLIALFKLIIPNDTAGGKEDFLAGLQSLRTKYKGKKTLTQAMSEQQEGSEDAVILNVFRMLKIHLTNRAETYASSDRQQKDIEARLNGAHIGDKITGYVEGVINLAIGSGQSPANRLAGLVLMYGFYKSARLAMKGDTPAGKAFRALFVAGAVEIAAKEITGRGVLDRLGMDAISGAMEGTYEAVLLQDAEKRMKDKDITKEAHAAALMELNDVPFSQLMEWYESSTPNGMPRTKGAKDLFPKQINLNGIEPKITWGVKDKKLEARRVVYETVKHFFGYVGDKDNHRDAHFGKEALKERWVTMIDRPNYKPKYSSYDHGEWIRAGGVKKSDITWQMVMRAEISDREVDLTKGKTPMGQLETGARELYTDLSEWMRLYVANPGVGYTETFMQEMGEKAHDTQAFFEEVYKNTERQIYFTKEKIVFWYGAHEYEIRRVAENHWQLLVTGLKLPFLIVAGVDDWAIPWSVTKLKQIEESLKPVKESPLTADLTPADIASDFNYVGVPNLELNRNFSYFGIYQEPFLLALRDPDNYTQNVNVDRPKDKKFYEDPGSHVGYYISEVTYKDAGIDLDDPRYAGKPGEVQKAMYIESKRRAERQFRIAGMNPAETKYNYPIHTAFKAVDPPKMYVFWRMPLRESAELHLMESKTWADYYDPNKRRDREPFMVDPSQTSWENLSRALELDIGPARVVLSKAGGYAAMVPRIVFWHLGVARGVARSIGGFVLRKKPEERKAFEDSIDAATDKGDAYQQMTDELFTSAASQHQAISDYYKQPVNAKLYEFALKYAHGKQKPLFLGFMVGRDGYGGTQYLKPYEDEATIYGKMWDYYQTQWIPTHGKRPDPDIEAALNEANTRIITPPVPGAAPAGAQPGVAGP